MTSRRRYRQSGWIALALLTSATAQGAVLLGFELGRSAPEPVLTIERVGGGDGDIRIERSDTGTVLSSCLENRCQVTIPRNTPIRIVTNPADGSVFGGYEQRPMRTPAPLRNVLGDPLAKCGPDSGGDILICGFSMAASVELAVVLDLPPEEVEVAWVKAPDLSDVVLPPSVAPPLVPLPADKPKATPPPPPPIDAERLDSDRPLPEEKEPPPPLVDLTIKPPPPPPPPEPPPPPPAEMAAIPPNMRMVEVTDDNEVEQAPDDATNLSDKNRDVAVETAATDTNLEKELTGTQVASIKSDDTTSAEIGGPDDIIRQNETTEATTPERIDTSDHSGDKSEAIGAIQGEGGDKGDNGSGPDAPGGMLAMRGIGGRGSLVDQVRGDGKKPGEKGAPGIGKRLDFDDYERLIGKEKVDAERELAARTASAKKGRWEKKFASIKSSLQNFVPDIQPGNQTALKTRAHPFAVYVARMHRRIHELWGFGFLEGLDDKPANYELNDFELWTNIEVSLNPDGSIYKTTIAHPSGKLTFDVAALDTIASGGPYGATPEEIRSVDGRVYLRWGFYRNWRQCGTFNVEPYILTSIPGGIVAIEEGATAPVRGTATVTPDSTGQGPDTPKTSVADDEAKLVANLWVSGYATADVAKMLKYSAVPFRVDGEVAAESTGDLSDSFKELIVEAGPLKKWNLLTPSEYAAKVGAAVDLPAGALVLLVQTTKQSLAMVMVKSAGSYRVVQLTR